MQRNSDRKRSLFAFPWGLVAGALLVAVAIRALVLQVYLVPSGSMQPALRPGDRVLVEKISPRWSPPQPGQIVVFDGTDVWDDAANGLVVTKRVVGVAGDRMRCCDASGRIMRNGVAVREPYADGPTRPFDITVPEGRLWVLGDDRAESLDSSAYLRTSGGGSVPVNHVIGRVIAVVWPLSHAGILASPPYGGLS